MSRRETRQQTLAANQFSPTRVRAAGGHLGASVVGLMVHAMVASSRRLHHCGFGQSSWHLACHRAPLPPAITTPEVSFCGSCNVQQTHSVRRLLAACGLRSVPDNVLKIMCTCPPLGSLTWGSTPQSSNISRHKLQLPRRNKAAAHPAPLQEHPAKAGYSWIPPVYRRSAPTLIV